ncbi:MAG: hypothetical protein RBU37_24070 [Myxococcota bacterium]|nr:hypothetical protein [Myxococcota bacterium]
MRVPSSLSELAASLSSAARRHIGTFWKVEEHELALGAPGDVVLYELLDTCGREERWTLFDVIDNGGSAPHALYPRRMGPDGSPIPFDATRLRERGLLFLVRSDDGESHFVVADELLPGIQRYREQLLLMKIDALLGEFEQASTPIEPLQFPAQIKPHLALSHLLSSSDPEGFRYPLSRALAIPESFPVNVKRTLRRLLHDFYLMLLPCLGRLRGERCYPLEGLVTLSTAIAALISQHHSQALEAELCNEDKRPFASANHLLSGARKGLWRSFLVLLLDGFLDPIGATRRIGPDGFQVYPPAYSFLDLEIKRSDWLVACLAELSIEVKEGVI